MCKLPPVSGECISQPYVNRTYFDKDTGQCETFMYREGCEGNDNNFLTVEACIRGCTNGNYLYYNSLPLVMPHLLLKPPLFPWQSLLPWQTVIWSICTSYILDENRLFNLELVYYIYTYIVGKYIMYLRECKLILYLTTMYVHCVYPAILQSPKHLPNCLKIIETSVVLIVFNWVICDVSTYTAIISFCRPTWMRYQKYFIRSMKFSWPPLLVLKITQFYKKKDHYIFMYSDVPGHVFVISIPGQYKGYLFVIF